MSQVNGGMLEVKLLPKVAESALLSENAKKSHLKNPTYCFSYKSHSVKIPNN